MDPDNVFQALMAAPAVAPAPVPPPDPTVAPSATPAPAAPPQNVMQAAAPAPAAPPPTQDPGTAIAQAATDASPPMPKPRRSLLDTIGHISDVLAQVGGAAPLYQPTLDARQDRQIALSDHDRKVAADNLALQTGKFNLQNSETQAANDERSRFANVLAAVNDPDDAAQLPSMMTAAGLTDPKYAPFVKMVQDNPDAAKTLSSALGADTSDDVSKQIKTGYDAAGNRIAYTVDSEGNTHVLGGVTPDMPLKVVNTGDKTSVYGPDGKPITILPNKVSPNTAANNAQSNTNNIRSTNATVTAAGIRAGGKAGAPAKADPQAALDTLDNIQSGFNDLHNMQALPGDGGALNQVEGALGRTGIGQKIGEQFGSPAAQKRLEVIKNINTLQSAMIQSLPGSATRTKFEQEIQKARLPDPTKMSYGTAMNVIGQLRTSYQKALQAANSEVSSRPAPTAPTSRPAGWENAPMLSPSDAAKLPSGSKFISLDGRPLTRN